MLALRLASGSYLDLDPKTALTLNFQCPIFDREAIERSWSYPFTLPATPRNLAALGYANRLDAATVPKTLDVVLYVQGVPFPDGVLRITGASSTGIKAAFQSRSIDVVEKLKLVRMRELGTGTVDVARNLQATFHFAARRYDFEFPDPEFPPEWIGIKINGVSFAAGYSLSIGGLLNQINAVFPGLAGGGDAQDMGDYLEWTLSLDHSAVDELVVENIPDGLQDVDPNFTIKFLLTGADLGTEVQRIGAEYQTFLAAQGTAAIRFPVIYAPNLYSTENSSFSGYANFVSTDNVHPLPSSLAVTDTGWAHTVLPLPTLKGLFDALAAAGWPLAGVWAEDPELQTLLLWQNKPADAFLYPEMVIPTRREPAEKFRTYPFVLRIADYVPDLTAMELIQNLCATFAWMIFYRRGRIELQPIRDSLRTPPEDWTSRTEPDYSVTIEEKQAVTLDYDRQDDETDVPGQLQRVDGGEDALEFVSPFFTLHELDQDQPGRIWRVPYTAEEGQSEHFSLKEKPSLRLLFYRGLQPDSQGNEYALATHGRFDYAGNTVGHYSLDWQGVGGLQDAWWNELFRLLQHGRTVRRLVRLSVADLVELIRWRRPRKYIYSEGGTMVGVVRSVKVKVDMKGMSIAEIKFQKEP